MIAQIVEGKLNIRNTRPDCFCSRMQEAERQILIECKGGGDDDPDSENSSAVEPLIQNDNNLYSIDVMTSGALILTSALSV